MYFLVSTKPLTRAGIGHARYVQFCSYCPPGASVPLMMNIGGCPSDYSLDQPFLPVYSGSICALIVSAWLLTSLPANSLSVTLHDWPLGGKLESVLLPSEDSRIKLRRPSDVQSPFHSCNATRLLALSISGIQNPELYSCSSEACFRFIASSLVLAGLPGRRSAFRVASSSSSRFKNL